MGGENSVIAVMVVFVIFFIAIFLLIGYLVKPFVKAKDQKGIVGYAIKSLIFCFAAITAGLLSSVFW